MTGVAPASEAAVEGAASTAVPVTAPVVEAAPAPAPEPVVAEAAPAAEAAPDADLPPAEGAAEAAAEGADSTPGSAAETGADTQAAAAADAALDPAAAQAAAVAAYPEWKLPEGMTMPADQLSAYNNILGKYGLTPEAGQELMDFGGAMIKRAQDQVVERNAEAFAEMRQGWVKSFDADTGNRRNTVLADAKAAIVHAVPNEKARQEVWNALAITGAGDHPALIKALAALGKGLRERAAPGPSTPHATTVSAAERRYGRQN